MLLSKFQLILSSISYPIINKDNMQVYNSNFLSIPILNFVLPIFLIRSLETLKNEIARILGNKSQSTLKRKRFFSSCHRLKPNLISNIIFYACLDSHRSCAVLHPHNLSNFLPLIIRNFVK